MTDQELLDLNALGFIPGPGETEEAFSQRISATQNSFLEKEPIPRAHWEWSRHHLKELFGFQPDSLIAFYSNKGLAPWQAAVCWIDEKNTPQLQLREGFRKGHFLRLYSREETLSHEAIHAARSAFNEPENEEFFAYATSEKKWRQVLGPLVKNPWEVWVFLAALLTALFWEWGNLVPLLCITFGFYRLIRQHRRRAKAAKTLLLQLSDKKTVRSVLFRLTDAEIRHLAKGREILGDDSVRWRLIRLAYFQ